MGKYKQKKKIRNFKTKIRIYYITKSICKYERWFSKEKKEKEYVRQLVDERAKNANQKKFEKTGQHYFDLNKGGMAKKPKKMKDGGIYNMTKMRYI